MEKTKSKTIDFLIALLLKYPQVNRARVDAESSALIMEFLVEEGLDEKDFVNLKKHLIGGIKLYCKYKETPPFPVQVYSDTFLSAGRITIVLSLQYLSIESTALLIELLEDACSSPFLLEDKVGQAISKQSDYKEFRETLEQIKKEPEDFSGFREKGRVLVFQCR